MIIHTFTFVCILSVYKISYLRKVADFHHIRYAIFCYFGLE